MIRPVVSISIIAGLFSACVTGSNICHNTNGNDWPEVANRDVLLNKKRSPIMFPGSVIADTCVSYINNIKSSPPEESVHNQLVKSEYLICEMIHLLSESEQYEKITTMSSGKKLAAKLDVRSFPSSLFQMADSKKITLNQLFPHNTKVNGPLISVETEDWSYTLEILASVRLKGRNSDSWMVRHSDEAKTGNYRSYNILLIHHPESPGYLKAEICPELN